MNLDIRELEITPEKGVVGMHRITESAGRTRLSEQIPDKKS